VRPKPIESAALRISARPGAAAGARAARVSNRDRFRAKTWIYRAQLFIFGPFGLFAAGFGIACSTGRMTNADGEPVPRTTAVPLLIVAGFMFVTAALALFNLIARATPTIRCYREGIECKLIGAVSPVARALPSKLRFLWMIVTLQGFRSASYRMRWSDFRGAQVTGTAMDYNLTLLGRATNVITGKTSAALTFPQVYFVDRLQTIAEALNEFAMHPELREGLGKWG
jgi:hypothetical protein